jgi:hypothetical protein
MPFYSFSHPNTGEIIDICFKMSDNKIYIDKNGVEWDRVITVPNMMMDSRIDPHSQKAFLDKTKKGGGTLGDLFDLSKELSDKRGGTKNDPIKKDYAKDWKARRGKNK